MQRGVPLSCLAMHVVSVTFVRDWLDDDFLKAVLPKARKRPNNKPQALIWKMRTFFCILM